MKADVILDNCTFVGIIGKNIEDIKQQVKERQALSDYGVSKLIVNIRED